MFFTVAKWKSTWRDKCSNMPDSWARIFTKRFSYGIKIGGKIMNNDMIDMLNLWKNITISSLPQLCYLHSRILITNLSPIIVPASSCIFITIRNLYHTFHRKLNWTYFSPKMSNRKYSKIKILNRQIIF